MCLPALTGVSFFSQGSLPSYKGLFPLLSDPLMNNFLVTTYRTLHMAISCTAYHISVLFLFFCSVATTKNHAVSYVTAFLSNKKEALYYPVHKLVT